MVTTSKKGAEKTKAKARNRSLKKSQVKQARTTEALRRERDEALEQLAAASDILRMLARSPTNLQPVLDAIAESAAKRCDAADAVVWRVDGDVFRLASHSRAAFSATASSTGCKSAGELAIMRRMSAVAVSRASDSSRARCND